MVETVIVLVPLTAATLVVVAPVELLTNMSCEFAGRPKSVRRHRATCLGYVIDIGTGGHRARSEGN